MTKRRILDSFELADFLILGGGLVGALLLFLAMPGEYPQRAAEQHITQKEAVAAARTFAEESSGIRLEDADARASIRKTAPLLDSLQEQFGRRRAFASLVRDTIPAFFWHVRWAEREGEKAEIGTTVLTLNGGPMGLQFETPAVPARAHHSEALEALIAEEAEVDSSVAAVDSVFLGRLAFRLDGEDESTPLSERAARGQRIFLNASDAARLAKYHLSRTALADVKGEADSVKASGQDGRLTATAHFSSVDTSLGPRYNVAVEVAPTGALVSLKADRTRPAADKKATFDPEAIADIMKPLLFAVLSIVLLVIFFRRLTARLVDARMALRDGLWLGLAAAIAVVAETLGSFGKSTLVEIAGVALTLLFAGGGAAVLIFFLSGAVSSITRDVWQEKLQSLDLLRSGVIRNVPVGRALLRGVFLAMIIQGGLAVFLILFPDLRMDISGDDAFYKSAIPGPTFLVTVAGNAFGSFFMTLTAIAGVGVLVRRMTSNIVLVIGAVAIVVGILQFSPLDMRPLWLEYAISVALGVALGWILWRFDLITVFTSIFSMFLIGAHLDAVHVPSSPEFIDFLLTVAAVAAIAVLGFVGTLSGKTSTEIPVIVPDYIEELAQRERLKREFELAREVQLSFLPAATPTVRGVEIASICLPATEVGGDYYDFFQMNGKLGVVVGDVSGKGMQAAFYMTLMKGILQSVVRQGEGPSAVLSQANELFRLNASRGTFMSMIFGVLDSNSNEWTFARAGHNPVVLARSSMPRPEVLQPKGAALGLASEHIFNGSIQEMTLSLAEGDVLVIYTDGITEAMNLNRELYDDARLLDVVARCRGNSADEMLGSIVADVEAFTGAAPRHDDMTLLVIRRVEE